MAVRADALPALSAPSAVRQLFPLRPKPQALALDGAPLFGNRIAAGHLTSCIRTRVWAQARTSALHLDVAAPVLLQRAQIIALGTLSVFEPALITQIQGADALAVGGLITLEL